MTIEYKNIILSYANRIYETSIEELVEEFKKSNGIFKEMEMIKFDFDEREKNLNFYISFKKDKKGNIKIMTAYYEESIFGDNGYLKKNKLIGEKTNCVSLSEFLSCFIENNKGKYFQDNTRLGIFYGI